MTVVKEYHLNELPDAKEKKPPNLKTAKLTIF